MPIFERHAFAGFDKEVRALRDILIQMRDQSIELMVYAKRTLDNPEDGYGGAKAIDKAINVNEIEADNKVYEIIAKYTPIGGEMRYIISMIKVAYIFERVADKVKNSIKRLCRVPQPLSAELREELDNMIEVGIAMLREAPALLGNYQPEGMEAMAGMKRTVSLHQKQALAHLQQMPADALSADSVSDIHFVIKNIERISDLMLDLAKVGYFISTGKKFERGQ